MAVVLPVRTYTRVFLALLGLLAVTVAAAYVDLGPFNIPVAMGIGAAKAVLIILFFMHVKSGARVLKLAVGAGFFWLLVMLVLVLADYLTRPMEWWLIFR
jgi:cytochrome c oxidase subunit 4